MQEFHARQNIDVRPDERALGVYRAKILREDRATMVVFWADDGIVAVGISVAPQLRDDDPIGLEMARNNARMRLMVLRENRESRTPRRMERA